MRNFNNIIKNFNYMKAKHFLSIFIVSLAINANAQLRSYI